MIRIFHVGPNPDHIGGISSVINALNALDLVDCQVECLTTWEKDNHGLRSYLPSVIKILSNWASRNQSIYHFHFGNRGSYLREGSLMMFSRVLGFKTVATFHGSKLHFKEKGRFWDLHLSMLPRFANRVVSLSPHTSLLLSRYKAKLVYATNPLPLEVLKLNTSSDLTNNLVLFIGTRDYRKGFDLFLRVVQELSCEFPQWNFGIVGPFGDCSSPVPDFVTDYGSMDRHKVLELMTKTKIVCLPTLAEQSSMVLWECLAMNVSVVTTNIGANRQILGDDYPFFCRPGEVVDLIRVMKSCMLTTDQEFKRTFAKRVEKALPEYQKEFWRKIYLGIFF
jgi:glycosyltransferase involved in cell wall biosynthesis